MAQTTRPAPATTRATQPTKTWTYEGPGRWSQKAQSQPTSELVENPTLDKVDRLLARHLFNTAKGIVLEWLRTNPHAPDRDRGLFLLAEAYYQYGDRTRAFYYLDELMDTYGESRLFYPALEKQYQIADAYLRGYKNRLFGLPIMSAQDDGIEMLFRIQERAPGSPLADRALLRTADYYYDNAEYDLAADAYGFYARRYPRSPLLARVLIRRAFASLAQFRGLNYDATPLVDAKAQLEAFRASFPEMAEQENVPAVIERINATLAAKLYDTGRFYERTHKPRGATYMYRYLVNRYPESRDADRARKRLERMPQWVLADPAPSPEAGEEDVPLTGSELEPEVPPTTLTKPGPRTPTGK
jgi:outer membrane assembly lipoprotein YfiO